MRTNTILMVCLVVVAGLVFLRAPKIKQTMEWKTKIDNVFEQLETTPKLQEKNVPIKFEGAEEFLQMMFQDYQDKRLKAITHTRGLIFLQFEASKCPVNLECFGEPQDEYKNISTMGDAKKFYKKEFWHRMMS